MTRNIHQIWLGTDPVPAEFAAWSKTWKAFHPGWEYRLWKDADAEEFPLYRRLLPLCSGAAAKADLLRLLILAKYGGIYTDMDTECVGAFDEILTGEAFAIGACSDEWGKQEGRGWVLTSNNGFIYAEKNCPQILAVIDVISRSYFVSIFALMFSGPWLEAVATGAGGITLLPYSVTTPMAPWEPVPDPLPVDCLAIHHYEGSWLADPQREALNLATRKTPGSIFKFSKPQPV